MTYHVTVPWEGQSGTWWNEVCINVIEVFGLPGQRFTFHPNADYMLFKFTKQKDAELCKILLSEHI